MKVIEYYNVGCVPCMVIQRKIEELKKKYSSLKVENKNIALHEDEVKELNIMSAPHIIVKDDNGNVLINEHGTPELISKIEALLK